MGQRKKIAIDAKELAKEKLLSLGYILLKLIKYLKDYDLILLSDSKLPDEYIPDNAIAVYREKKYSGGVDLFRYQKWMKKKMKEYKADIYFQINHFSVIRTRGIKQIVIVHDLYPLERIEKHSLPVRIAYRISMIGTLINADKILTVSNFTKKRLEHFFWKSAKIEVNYNGIEEPADICDVDSFACVEEPFCLMLGRVNYYKGTIRMAEIFDKYMSGCGYKLVIAGQATTDEEALRLNKMTARNNDIIWLNYVDNNTKEWLIRNCSLFIYASRYDGFGLPPLEAAIRKKKAVINDIEVLREISKGKGNYIDFSAEGKMVADALQDALEKNDAEQIDELYEIAKSYTWDRFANKVISAFEEQTH